MSSIKQLPPKLDFDFVAGRPFGVDVTCTGATITSPSVTMKTTGGDSYTTSPGVPTSVTVAGGVVSIVWETTDTAALNTTTRGKSYLYELSALVDGDGPFPLLAGVATCRPVGSSGTSSSTTATLTFTAGVTAVSLAVSLGASGGGGGATDLADLGDVTITAAASGDILRHNGTAWVDAVGTTHFEVAGAVAAHEADTTNVHGIADTSALVTTAGAPELIRDTIGTALVAGSNVTITVDDGGDTITIAGPDLSAYLTSAAAPELIRDTMGTALTAGSNITITVNDAGDTITIAASAAATDLGFAKRSGATYRQIPGVVQIARATAAWAANTYYAPIILTASSTFDEMTTEVTATGTATVMRFAVYNCGTDLQPTSLVFDSGTVSVTGTGTKTASISQTLAAGRYLLAWSADGSVTTNIAYGSPGQTFHNSLANNDTLGLLFVSGSSTAGFASTGTAWTSVASENRGFFYPILFRRTA